jgi:hypothetical protein
MTSELITLFANIALTLSFIVAVIFGIAQVKTANRDRRDRLTLETLRSFQTREFAELLHYVVVTKIPSNYKEWQTWNAGERIRFVQFGQQMESLGLLLAERFIDIDLVDKTLGSFVVSSWEKYKPITFELREKTDDLFLNEYFQWMAEQIDRRMKIHPRKPFFETGKNIVQ